MVPEHRLCPACHTDAGEATSCPACGAALAILSACDPTPDREMPTAPYTPSPGGTTSEGGGSSSAEQASGPYLPPNFDPPPPAEASSLPTPPGYVILRKLGQGGMGVVYQALQTRLKRLVALKMIRTPAGGGPERARFRAETEAVARLRHPHIVQIYDVSESDGELYCALEYVPGGSLDQKLRGVPLPARPAARLVERIARAMHAAHENNLVHRDLKPANILLEETDDGPEKWTPKVGDFGLAKFLDDDSPGLTQEDAILGTPSYMSPEQALGRAARVDRAADVYALGAILYECLTGRPPFLAASKLETLEQVRSQEPVAVRSLQPNVPLDLENITLRCLRKDPARRYPTALALAEDLRRFQAGEPVRARPVGRPERTWRWCRRNPLLAALGSLAAAALVSVAVLSGLFAHAEARNAADLRQAYGELGAAHTDLATALRKSEERRREVQRQIARYYLDRGLNFAQGNEADVGLLWLARGLASLPEAGAEDVEHTLRLALASWARAVHPVEHVHPHAHNIIDLDLAADGRGLVTVTDDNVAHVWEVGQEQSRDLPLAVDELVWAVRWAPDGERFFTSDQSGVLRRWDARTGAPVGDPWPTGSPLKRFAFTPDGKLLLTATDNEVVVRDASTGKPTGKPLAHPNRVRAVAVSRDGRLVATGAEDQKPRVWDLATRQEVGPPVLYNGTAIDAVALSPDGQTLACGGFGGSAFVVSLPRRGLLGAVKHQVWVRATSFHPTQDLLLTGGDDKTARLWSWWNGKPAGPPLRHAGIVWHALFEPTGERVLTADGHAVWVRRLARTLEPPLKIPPPIPNHPMILAPDGITLLAAADPAGAKSAGTTADVRCWDLTTARPVGKPLSDTVRPDALALSPDGRTALTLTERHLRLWRVPEGRPLGEFPGARGLRLAAFVGDGSRFVVGGYGADIRVHETATGKPAAPGWRQPDESPVLFSPDGRLVVMQLGDKGQGRLRDTLTGEAHGGPFRMAFSFPRGVFSPNGRRLAINAGHEMDLWDVAAARRLAVLKGHQDRLKAAAFSADGRWLVTGSADTTARVWDEKGRAAPFTLDHRAEVEQVAISPDGTFVLTAAGDRVARLWERASGRPLGPAEDARDVRFLRGGSLAWLGDLGRVALVAVPTAVTGPPEQVRLWCEVLTGLTLDTHDHPRPLDPEAWHARRNQLRTLNGAPRP